jgi:hypothetical protein
MMFLSVREKRTRTTQTGGVAAKRVGRRFQRAPDLHQEIASCWIGFFEFGPYEGAEIVSAEMGFSPLGKVLFVIRHPVMADIRAGVGQHLVIGPTRVDDSRLAP